MSDTLPNEVREAICADVEEALRSISVGEDADGHSYGILDAIAVARHEPELSGASDILRDASADILDAALSGLEAAGWEVIEKDSRPTIEEWSAEIDRVRDHWKGKLATLQREADGMREALGWVGEVYPATNPESGGAIVHMTWEQFNAMREQVGLKPVKGRRPPHAVADGDSNGVG